MKSHHNRNGFSISYEYYLRFSVICQMVLSYEFTYMRACMRVCAYVCVCVRTCACVHVRACVRVRTCAYVRVRAGVCGRAFL